MCDNKPKVKASEVLVPGKYRAISDLMAVSTCLKVEMLGWPPFEQLGRILKVHNAKVAPASLEEGLTKSNPATAYAVRGCSLLRTVDNACYLRPVCMERQSYKSATLSAWEYTSASCWKVRWCLRLTDEQTWRIGCPKFDPWSWKECQ